MTKQKKQGFSFFKKRREATPRDLLNSFFTFAQAIWLRDALECSMMTDGSVTVFIRKAREEDIRLHNKINPHRTVLLDKEFSRDGKKSDL